MDHGNHKRENRGFFASRESFVLIGFLAIGGFYLIGEHRVHLLSWWPLLFLLACPLMHFFMHGGHSEHSGEKASGSTDNSSSGNGRNPPPHQH
jgi:hypothetical protein